MIGCAGTAVHLKGTIMKTHPQKQRRKKLRRRPHYPRIFALLAVLAFIFGGVYAQLTVPEDVAAAPSAPQQSAQPPSSGGHAQKRGGGTGRGKAHRNPRRSRSKEGAYGNSCAGGTC